MNLFVCTVCGYIAFNQAPEKCPVCMSPKEKFDQKNNLFTESMEKSPEGAIKHTPVITVVKECKLIDNTCIDVIIKIGEVKHPMEEKHYILNVDCYLDDEYISRVMFTPSVNAAAVIHLKASGKKIRAVEHCNIHGWWQAEASL